MSDRTNLYMSVVSTNPEILARARTRLEEYSGGAEHYEDEQTDTELTIGANECRVGSALELAQWLEGDIAEFEEDFAYYVYEDPAYEWLGTICIHVPGLTPDYEGNCDADGGPVLSPHQITELLNIDADAELRVQLRLKSGRPWTEAFAHHAGAVKPVSPANEEER